MRQIETEFEKSLGYELGAWLGSIDEKNQS